VVDNEFTPCWIVCRMGRNMGYPAVASEDGRDPHPYLKQHPSEIRFLVANLIMPVIDGGEPADQSALAQR
jgi:hypothetical protein